MTKARLYAGRKMSGMACPPLLLGHRGVRNSPRIEENTAAAFEFALQRGCDGFEFDARRTADGCAVICHDAKAGGRSIAQTAHSSLGSLPQVEEIIQGFGGKAFLDIELKVKGLENKVLAALRENPPARDYVVSSFLPEVVLELKARSAEVPIGIICQKPRQLVVWRKLPVECVIVHKSLVTRRLVQVVQAAGRKIFVWTINDKATMLRLAGWGVDAIISDKPELMVETLRPTIAATLSA